MTWVFIILGIVIGWFIGVSKKKNSVENLDARVKRLEERGSEEIDFVPKVDQFDWRREIHNIMVSIFGKIYSIKIFRRNQLNFAKGPSLVRGTSESDIRVKPRKKVANTRQIIVNLNHYFFAPRFHLKRFKLNLLVIFLVIVGLTTVSFLALSFSLGPFLMTSLSTVLNLHPTIEVNRFTNPSFMADTNSWSVSAVNGATTPNGWQAVPGRNLYSTKDFLVMKYEAKCASIGSPAVGLTSPNDSTHGVYRDDGVRTPANNCTSANGRKVVSVASGYPITYINQIEAAARCRTVSVNGVAAHLITNKEWMTIARNVEAQPSNWSLGRIGSGYLYAGHNDNEPAKALVASSNDANRAAYTDANGTEATTTTTTTTATGQSGTGGGSQIRTLNLSNGSVIWDFAGNVWEWTNVVISGKNKPKGEGLIPNWLEFTKLTNYGSLSSDEIRPLASLYNSSSSYGVGTIYSGMMTGDNKFGMVRGGDFSTGYFAGAFAVHLANLSTSSNYSIGFRCSDPIPVSQSFLTWLKKAVGGNLVTAGSVADAKIVQTVNVGNTLTYDFSVYVYDNTVGNVGGTVSSSVAQLYYNGATITTTYINAGSGWWKLTGSLIGANADREYGVLVKSGKTVVVDKLSLAKQRQ